MRAVARIVENRTEYFEVGVHHRVINRDVKVVVRVVRTAMHPGAKRFADELLLPVEHRAEIVKFDAPQNLEVVFEDAPQRILNSEIRALWFANFGPKQLVGRFDWVGRVLVELRHQSGLSHDPIRPFVWRYTLLLRRVRHLLVGVDDNG